MTAPDSRLFPVQYPKAPMEDKDLLEWARKLIVALSLKDAKETFKKNTVEYAATIEYSPSTSNILSLTATGDATINAVSAKQIGPVWIIITNDSGVGHTITFGTGFRASGTLVGTTSKVAVVHFVSDGVLLYEVSRTTGL